MANTKITTAVIKDDAITTAKIADDAVTGALIADDVALAGNPTTTTQSAGNNTTRIATTAFVTTAINNLVDSAPSALDTLNELAAAMGDDANFSTTVTNSIATKLPLAGGTMTGNIAHASDFTLDVGGGITFDADGGQVDFKDNGTLKALIDFTGNNVEIQSRVTDADLLFRGQDGSSFITALTLDMSDAGAATFNSSVTSQAIIATNASGTPSTFNGADNNNTLQVFAGTTSNQSFGLLVDAGTSASDYAAEFRKADNTTIMRILGDGNVSVGNPSYGSSLGQLRVINDASVAPASLSLFGHNNLSDDDEFAKIDFASQISGTGGNPTAKIAANIEGTNERAAHLTFHTHNDGGSLQERLRIDSDGNVLVGTTDTTLYNNTSGGGIGLMAANRLDVARAGDVVATFNRMTDAGQVIQLYQAGSLAGGLGVSGTDATIGTGDTGITFEDAADVVHPVNYTTGAARDAAVSLGKSAARFKDLYLANDIAHLDAAGNARLLYDKSANLLGNAGTNVHANGIYLGGTGSANLLDDYEEGVYGTSFNCSVSGSITLNGAYNNMQYTKVGRLVTVTGYFIVSSVSSPNGVLQITVPFQSVNTSSNSSSVDLSFNVLSTGSLTDAWGIIDHNSNTINVYVGSGTSVSTSFANRIVSGTDLRLTATYIAA